MRNIAVFITAYSFLCAGSVIIAQTPQGAVSLPGVQLFAITGRVEIGKEGQKPTSNMGRSKDAKIDFVLQATPGDIISTLESSGASVTLGNGALTGTARLGPNTIIKIPEDSKELQSLELLKGRLFLNINGEQLKQQRKGEFRLKTPAALLAVKGTRFFVMSGTKEIIGTHEGTVAVTTSTGIRLLPAGMLIELNEGNLNQPRQMTSVEANIASEYAKADLTTTHLHLATPSQKPAIKDGVILDWGVSKGYRDNPNGMYDLPTGERSEPLIGKDDVLRYAFNNPSTQEPNHSHEMQAGIILRGEARKLEENRVIAITFLIRDPGWGTEVAGSNYYYPFRISMSKSNLNATMTPTNEQGVVKVTAPCGQITAKRFSEQTQIMKVALPNREKGKNYEIEMWDFKVLTRPQ